MAHKRTLIRDKIAALLLAIPARTAGVFKTRMVPVHQNDLPAYLIYAMEEDVRLQSRDAQERNLVVNIEVVFSGVADLDHAADDHAVLIETTIGGNRTLDGLAYDTILTATKLGTFLDGERRNGSCTLSYTVIYRTAVNNPENTNP
jgi:hypothetical protein